MVGQLGTRLVVEDKNNIRCCLNCYHSRRVSVLPGPLEAQLLDNDYWVCLLEG